MLKTPPLRVAKEFDIVEPEIITIKSELPSI
jgi:hypothetical protein